VAFPAQIKEGRPVAFQDKTLPCKECGTSFVFSAGEQEFYQSRGLVHEPARCPSCRSQRRQQRAGGESVGAARAMYTAQCANCGQEAQVPFEPRLGRPVYCSTCFATMRGGGR
jgi:CxxC-x17-CxxC domain-containing protein